MSKYVLTVKGKICPEEMGYTLIHEHVAYKQPVGTREDLDKMNTECALCVAAGVKTIVDGGPVNFGRYVQGLKKVSDTVGLHVIACTGYMDVSYNKKDDPQYGFFNALNYSEDQLYDLIMRDITVGCDGTDIKAGHLKWGTSLNKIDKFEHKSFKAVARAQKETGYAVFTHTEKGTMAIIQAEMFLSEGVDPSRVCIGHMDIPACVDVMEYILGKGFYVDFDHVGREEGDKKRIDMVKYLINKGFAERIMITGDMGKNSYLKSFGGKPGMDYIPGVLMGLMRDAGISQEDLDTIMVKNPARFYAVEE